jgi:hypothetical protein
MLRLNFLMIDDQQRRYIYHDDQQRRYIYIMYSSMYTPHRYSSVTSTIQIACCRGMMTSNQQRYIGRR